MSVRRVVVIGAGKRVLTDVLPAVAARPGRRRLGGVYARSEREESVGGRPQRVRALDSLGADGLGPGDLLHLSVGKAAVPKVLGRLLERDVSGVDLLIDTPVMLFKHLHHARKLAAFRSVSVAEDCAALPWVGLVRDAIAAGRIGPLQQLVFDRSAWRYHGLALAKALLGTTTIRRVRRRSVGKGGRVELLLGDGLSAVIIEPRDYARGFLLATGLSGAITDAAAEVEASLRLLPIVEGERCRGFRLGEAEARLDDVESELLGAWGPSDSATARMEDLKRVGLLRLLEAIDAGEGGYPLDEGLEDMAVDYLAEKLGRWRRFPLWSVKAPSGRALMGAAMRLVGGG